MYNSEPVKQMLENDSFLWRRRRWISFDTVVQSVAWVWACGVWGLSTAGAESRVEVLDVFLTVDYFVIMTGPWCRHFLFVKSAAVGAQCGARHDSREERFSQLVTAWSIHSCMFSTALHPCCCRDHKQVDRFKYLLSLLNHFLLVKFYMLIHKGFYDSCSPWFPFHCCHQFDHLQQQEGETRLKHTNQLHHFLDLQPRSRTTRNIRRLCRFSRFWFIHLWRKTVLKHYRERKINRAL